MAIGFMLAGVAIFLANESRGLLVGEAADPGIVNDIRSVLSAEDSVSGTGRLLTMHLGPDEILLNLELRFRPTLDAAAVARSIAAIERRIRERQPRVTKIFIEAAPFREAAR